MRCLLVASAVLLGLAPVGVCVGVWLAAAPGWGICAGSVGYAALSVYVLSADLLPDPAPREVSR